MANEEGSKRRNRRSKASKAKAQAKGRKAMVAKAKDCRSEQVRESSLTTSVGRLTLYPKVSATWQTQLAKVEKLGGSTEIHQFYEDHCFHNVFLRVSEEPNVSNPTGRKNCGKGVFARTDIPRNALLCPYVGYGRNKPCRLDGDNNPCCYDLWVREGFYICARDVKFDSRYLMLTKPTDERKAFDSVQAQERCPPNYGRYVNTLTKVQREAGMKFNARFQLDEEGENVHVISNRAIAEGEEIVAYYGNWFGI